MTDNHTTAAGRRNRLITVLGGLVGAVLMLSGCGRPVAAGPRLAQITAVPTSAATATPSASATEDWTEAGQVTVTPDSASDAALALTPGPDSTVDGSVAATPQQPIEFAGAVEILPGTGNWAGNWQVGGRLVHVTSSTTIDQRQGRVAPGAQVTVEGWPQTDGSVSAAWVIVNIPAAGEATAVPALPTVTPVPAAAQPVATDTPVPPADQPAATDTPAPPPPSEVQPQAQATAGPAYQGDDEGREGENDSNRAQTNGDENEQNDGKQGKDKQNDNGQGKDKQNDNGQNGSGNENARASRPVEFRDVVQNMPDSGLAGTWVIGDQTVNVNAGTRVQGAKELRTGAIVQVMGWQQPDGSINAAYLMVKKNMNNKGPAGNAPGGGPGQGNGRGNGNGNGNDKGNGNGNGNDKGNGHGNGKGKKSGG